MKTKPVSGIMLTLLLIGMSTLAFNIQSVKAEPKTWYVDDSGGKNFTKIQDAIYAASPGDTIYVYNGTYYEHIYIDKSLTLIGENKYATIIDGSGYGPVVVISASGMNFTRFTVRNAGWAVWERDNGIRLYRTWSSRVTDCIVLGCAYGIREIRERWKGGKNVISGNIVSDATEIAIGSSHASSMDNIVADNTIINSTNGIYFNNPYNMQIIGNHIFGQEGKYSHYGIHLQVGGLNNTIIGNMIEYSENAIRLDYADSNVVEKNAVENCTFGVFVGYESSDNIVSRNIASHSTIGIMIWDNSNNNTVINNKASNNYYGIGLSSSNHNKIYHNNFLDNTYQVYSYDSVNIWDGGYPVGGNYWSDYGGDDFYSGPGQDEPGSDGIGDDPYVIDAENQDNYPLVNPWTPAPPMVSAMVDVNPDTLNLRSMGEWITCYIELPEGYNVSDIDIYSIRLNNTFSVSLLPNPPEPVPTEIGDYDNDTIPDLMVKFNMTELTSHIYHVLGIKYGNVTLTVTGMVDGTLFEGEDTVKVMLPGDVDCDGDVDAVDYILFIGSYGCSIEDPGYDPNADLDSDSNIDEEDFMIFTGYYGTEL